MAERDGHVSYSGLLLAVMSASSMRSGAYYGARNWTMGPGRRYVWLTAGFAVLVAPLPLVDSIAQFGWLLVLVGLAYAPSMISAYLLLDDLAPDGTVTEAYTWLVSANAAGGALGAALAGVGTHHTGVRGALAVAVVGATVALALVMLFRTRLAAPAAGRA